MLFPSSRSKNNSFAGPTIFSKSELSDGDYKRANPQKAMPVRRSPREEQPSEKPIVPLSPRFYAESQNPSAIPSHVGISETLSDLWPTAHRGSGAVATKEPLAYTKTHLPSHHNPAGLPDQNESLLSVTSPSTVTIETESTNPAVPSGPPPPSDNADVVGSSTESILSVSKSGSASGTSQLVNVGKATQSPTESRIECPSTGQGKTNSPNYTSPPVRAAILQAALPLFQGTIALPSAQSRLPNPLASTLARDTLLSYAYRIFGSPFQPIPGLVAPVVVCDLSSPQHPYHTKLLPLLRNLKLLHPRSIPVLLLLGCVYHAVGDYAASLEQNEEILEIDDNFVEAMSNIGTALKAMGRIEDAEKWWQKAISIKPTYWDAIYNLLGILISPEIIQFGGDQVDRHTKALELCESLRSKFIDKNGRLAVDVPPSELHHVQNVLYVGATIRWTILGSFLENSLADFILAIEVLLYFNSRGEALAYSFKDLFVAGIVAALILTSSLPPSVESLILRWQTSKPAMTEVELVSSSPDLLSFIHDQMSEVLDLLLSESDGMLPTVFLSPMQAAQLSSIVFSAFRGSFPALLQWASRENKFEGPSETVKEEVGKITSSLLLSIAKILQENQSMSRTWFPGFDGRVRSSSSFVLMLYYLAYCFHPSASICNNMGILLSTIPWTNVPAGLMGQQDGVVVYQLARDFYEEGLRILSTDGSPESKKSHPHLLTNYGSLLKELGDTETAIAVYAEAVKLKPDFDIALANLANALKDSGRLAESIVYYRQAVVVNKNLPEALCGMVHAVWSICDWRGLGEIDSSMSIGYDGIAHPASSDEALVDGWMPMLIDITRKQIYAAYTLNRGIIRATGSLEEWLGWIEASINVTFSPIQRKHWIDILQRYFLDLNHEKEAINEGGFMIRVVEWLTKVLQWRWYSDVYGNEYQSSVDVRPLYSAISVEHRTRYRRPRVSPTMSLLPVPSVLPFHTFIYPFNPRELRLVARRNAFRTSQTTLMRPWLPEHVYPPPPPPHPRINIGYVSSDFNDHPTAHLLQSVFGMHDKERFRVFAYATTTSDQSRYRTKIEAESEHFRDVSAWSTQQIVEQIIQDEIHILVNLNGYTKGARNDIFAARPSPVQISLLGFAGTLAAGWCDYMICDVISCPPATRFCEICELKAKHQSSGVELTDSSEIDFNVGPDPESVGTWKYAEKLIYMPHTYLVTDHKQTYGSGANEAEPRVIQHTWTRSEVRRRRLRKILFPDLFEDTVIFANFNQMYKIDPSIFATWLRILKRVPNSILWLLRFPQAAEEHLLRTAEQWESQEIKSRIRFTEVAPKSEHIERACVADMFLDTVECNAHTVAADVLWSGVPIITWSKYDFKMCSRVGASIAYATGYGEQMVVDGLPAYEERAVKLALSVTPLRRLHTNAGRVGRDDKGELSVLRKNLFLNRGTMPLFDTKRWTRNLEKGYEEAWRRWVQGGTFLHFNMGDSEHQYEKCNGFIWIRDEET